MNTELRGIIIGILSGLITYLLTETFNWEINLSLWKWCFITIVIILLICIIRYLFFKIKLKRITEEFTEASFGDSYIYTWRFKRSKGKYSAYGYEATDIRTKRPLSELNNETRFTFGHEVPEETIKLFIQLILIANIDKKIGLYLKPLLEYLNWTEDSQKHQLLH